MSEKSDDDSMKSRGFFSHYVWAIKNEVNTSGFRIRIIARLDMLVSIGLMLLYTYWLFQLPRDWDPSLEQQGPLYPKQYRVFCFFVYIVALLINSFQFFTSFLLFGSVQEGVIDREDVIATSEYYIALSFIVNVVLFAKFHLMFFYLDFGKLLTVVMTLPEMIFHTVAAIIVILFMSVLKKTGRGDGSTDEEAAGLEANAEEGDVVENTEGATGEGTTNSNNENNIRNFQL